MQTKISESKDTNNTPTHFFEIVELLTGGDKGALTIYATTT